jgi:hypothetical protein
MKPPHLQHLVETASVLVCPQSRQRRAFGVFGEPRFRFDMITPTHTRQKPPGSSSCERSERSRREGTPGGLPPVPFRAGPITSPQTPLRGVFGWLFLLGADRLPPKHSFPPAGGHFTNHQKGFKRAGLFIHGTILGWNTEDIFLKIEIEIENTKITLSVGAEGVTIDTPPPMDEETRQTTLSEAQWSAYAKGRADEARHWNERFKAIVMENDRAPIAQVGAELIGEFPSFEDLVEVEAIPTNEWPQNDPDEQPPKVDPITGNIAGWVKTFREAENKRRRAPEAQPRAVCVSSCCGTEGARTRDGSCWGCR